MLGGGMLTSSDIFRARLNEIYLTVNLSSAPGL